jgi:hypothetical protein
MANSIVAAISRVLRDNNPNTDEVHFHKGPSTTPAVCFDARCESPRMDVR